MEKKILEEIWVPIVGYEGAYEVSTHQRIRSLTRKVRHHCRPYIKPGRILVKYINTTNYYTVLLYISENRSRRLYLVSRIMATAFIPNPNNLPVVNHINRNTLDDRPENLEWVTIRENLAHGWQTRTSKYIGVRKRMDSKKWEARVQIKGKCEYLGVFDTPELARDAYINRLKEG